METTFVETCNFEQIKEDFGLQYAELCDKIFNIHDKKYTIAPVETRYINESNGINKVLNFKLNGRSRLYPDYSMGYQFSIKYLKENICMNYSSVSIDKFPSLCGTCIIHDFSYIAIKANKNNFVEGYIELIKFVENFAKDVLGFSNILASNTKEYDQIFVDKLGYKVINEYRNRRSGNVVHIYSKNFYEK